MHATSLFVKCVVAAISFCIVVVTHTLQAYIFLLISVYFMRSHSFRWLPSIFYAVYLLFKEQLEESPNLYNYRHFLVLSSRHKSIVFRCLDRSGVNHQLQNRWIVPLSFQFTCLQFPFRRGSRRISLTMSTINLHSSQKWRTNQSWKFARFLFGDFVLKATIHCSWLTQFRTHWHHSFVKMFTMHMAVMWRA